MRKHFRAFSIVAALVVCSTFLNYAAAQDPEQPVLPDLAPREVEIRGELVIRFPLLERQPLIGFNPPPRIPVIAAGRIPLLDEYKQGRADLPQTAISRPSPPATLLSGSGPITGELETAAGSYFTRLVRARLAGHLGRRMDAVTRFDYRGTDGSEILNSLPAVKNTQDSFDGRLTLLSSRRRATVRFEADAYYDRYSAFGLAPDLVDPLDVPGRDARGGRTDLSVSSAPGASTGYHVKFGGAASTWNSDDTSADLSDVRGDVLTAFQSTLSSVKVWGDALGGLANVGTFLEDDLQQVYYSGALGVGLGSSGRARLDVGLRLIGAHYDALSKPQGPAREIAYLAPDVRVHLELTEGLLLEATNRATVETNELTDLHHASPYLRPVAAPEPTVRYLDSRVGLTLSTKRTRWVLFAEYDRSPNMRYFSSVADSAGLIDVRYDDGRALRAGADIGVSLRSNIQATAGISVFDGRLTDLDVDVPYEPDFTVRAAISYRIARPKVLFQLSGTYEGKRHTTHGLPAELGEILDLNLLGTLDLTRNIGLTFRALNLAQDELVRWSGYPDSSLRILGGVRILW